MAVSNSPSVISAVVTVMSGLLSTAFLSCQMVMPSAIRMLPASTAPVASLSITAFIVMPSVKR